MTWKSTGLEVTSAHFIYAHPSDQKLDYATMSDDGGMVSEDGGSTWRLLKHLRNSIVDFGFDPGDSQVAYVAASDHHDFPLQNTQPIYSYSGGIYKTNDRGHTFTQLTPSSGPYAVDYMSVRYNHFNKNLYAGTRGNGVAVSIDDGLHWNYLNDGFPVTRNGPGRDLMINQIEIDPSNGNVYALLNGDDPNYDLRGQIGLYFLDVNSPSPRWKSLRGNLSLPTDLRFYPWNDASTYILFPVRFAIDWRYGVDDTTHVRSVIWLVDDSHIPGNASDSNGNLVFGLECYLHGGLWKTEDSAGHWTQVLENEQPKSVAIDNTGRVYAVAGYQPEIVNSNGILNGVMYSDDGGKNWLSIDQMAQKGCSFSVTPDANDQSKIFLGTHGCGVLYGPR